LRLREPITRAAAFWCLVLMNDDLPYRVTRRALAGYHLGLGTDMVLSCRFPKIDDIKAGKVQDVKTPGSQ